MKVTEREIESIHADAGQWQRQIVALVFEAENSEQLKYQGDAFISQPNRTHRIEFELKTNPVRPVHIEIPFSVSVPASVTLLADGHRIDGTEAAASTGSVPTLHVLTSNVTKTTEGHANSLLQLRVSYGGQTGTTSILLGNEQGECKLRLIQPWSWRYALQSLTFFALAWGVILGLSVLIVVNLRAFGDAFRNYAVLAVVAGWLFSVLGIPDLAKIPLRTLLRRFYGWTSSHRVVSVTALTLIFILIGLQVARVIYSLRVRQTYSNLILQAMEQGPDQDEAIKRAFALMPWRKEAQFLFERRAWALRDDMAGFRKHIRAFVSQPDVTHAIAFAASDDNLPFYADKNVDSAFSDPVVWYASILPEADDEGERTFEQMAMSLLGPKDGDNDAEAKILRTYFRLALVQRDPGKAKEAAGELRNLLAQYTDYKTVGMTQTYQMACDILACYYIVHCQSRDASEWFRRELDSRNRQQTLGDMPLWHRPPEKLKLYHMFLSKANATGVNVEKARQLLEYRGSEDDCEPYEKEFEETIFKDYRQYQDRVGWLKGTVLSAGLNTLIKSNMLDRGWRY